MLWLLLLLVVVLMARGASMMDCSQECSFCFKIKNVERIFFYSRKLSVIFVPLNKRETLRMRNSENIFYVRQQFLIIKLILKHNKKKSANYCGSRNM
jgi:hypothetical protein